MRRLRFPIPLSIVLFLALTLAGTYYVRKGLLERAMARALTLGDEAMIRSLLDSWPCPVNVRAKERRQEDRVGDHSNSSFGILELWFEGGRETPLLWAVWRGDIELVTKCLVRGADPNAKGNDGDWTPLWAAVFRGRAEILRALLAHGGDVNARDGNDCTLVSQAARSNQTEIVKVLLGHGADATAPNRFGETPLHGARSLDVARMFVERGADVNAVDQMGRRPLHNASSPEAAAFLIARGADVNARDKQGRTPLHLVESFEVTRLLVERGADIGERDVEGKTPLHGARTAGMVRLLVAAGADVNAKAADGRTPLHCAIDRWMFGKSLEDTPGALEGNRLQEIGGIEALLASGADVNAKANDGKTPLQRLLSSHDANVMAAKSPIRDILLKAGATE